MIATTKICLAYNYYVLAMEDEAKQTLNSLDWNNKIKDAEWNRSIADLYGFLGDHEMEVKYLKRANKYE